jgi:cytochrome c oxidase assembly protein subunit 15
LGGRRARPNLAPPDWTAALAKVAAVATLLLVVVGGLVTSHQAGLAVADWPTSYGYNMFLYPLSRMIGGIYYEHAHRLFGSLVGLTTLALAAHLLVVERRRGVKALALTAVVMVIVQGVLGGLRVTGRLPLGADPEAYQPVTALAVVHGVLGQVFFATMVVLAVVTSVAWKRGPGAVRAPQAGGRAVAGVLVGLLLVQVALGAALRHLDQAMLLHVALAAVVFVVALVCALPAAGSADPAVRRTGWALAVLTIVQVLLGFGALVATRMMRPPAPGPVDVTLATAHQAVGALLLGAAAMLWTLRSRWRVDRPAATVMNRPATVDASR